MFAVCSDPNRRSRGPNFYLLGPTAPSRNVSYAYGYNDSGNNPFSYNDSRYNPFSYNNSGDNA
jgi:hypothetical protein